MPVNRVKEVPHSTWPGAKRSKLMSIPEYDYVMHALRKGLNGECLEIILDPKDLETYGGGIKSPEQAFVHLLAGSIKTERLEYVVKSRKIDGPDKPSRIYIMSGYVDYLTEKKKNNPSSKGV